MPEDIEYVAKQLGAEKITNLAIRELTSEDKKLKPDSLSNIAHQIYQNSDRREREEGLAQAIRYFVNLLNLELSNIGYGTMKAICETTPTHDSSVQNPFSIKTFDSGDRPLLSLVLYTLGKEELGRAEEYDLDICYEAEGSKWLYSGWAGDNSLDGECRELTDSAIMEAFDKLLSALLVLSETFPKTVPSILQQARELQKTLREMNTDPESTK
ncbi:MAG: hypothetical protein HOC71_10105 [Candidatus Latescibacteria bacterium]|nr:hypothetical protein [Candidatus Latescibacterota bacterium]